MALSDNLDPEPVDASEQERWLFEEVLPHETDLRGWLRNRFPVIKDVDDLVQESYRRLLQAKQTGSIANSKAFLFVVARNLALNQIRHLQYERPKDATNIDPLTIVADVNSPLESVEHQDDLEQLIEAIQCLPQRCRQIFTLRKIYGLSQKEVAAKLGVSVKTVEAQVSIGLRKCLEFFEKQEFHR
ncbi:MAG: RNA polymerase sigma factor [Synoicihabitans sp.]